MDLIPFFHLFPEQGQAETRVFKVSRHPGVPDDEYALFEAYCPDPKCHCRRVMLNVVCKRQQRALASISFGFERDDELAGPFLDPLNRQSEYAAALLELVKGILASPSYVAQLEAHYYQVKGVAADPKHPARKTLASMRADEDLEASRSTARTKSGSPTGSKKRRR